ncbi:MAG: RHS repeat-associated core domain-containing protein, partial [Candidatus Polarisedimenticolia bacterium]
GHERDAETGLDYMPARYHASSAGAFLTVDPLDASAKAEDPLSWNRYAYVRGNPLNRVDPTGEEDTAKQADTHGAPPDAGNKESPEERERRAKLERLRQLQREQLKAGVVPIPDQAVLDVMQKAVDRMKKDHSHEEGGVYGVKKTSGASKAYLGTPGPWTDVTADHAQATIEPLVGVGFDALAGLEILGEFHVHPDDTVQKGGIGFSFVARPSRDDKRAVRAGEVNYVLAPGKNTVYAYDSEGNEAEMDLDAFLSGGR